MQVRYLKETVVRENHCSTIDHHGFTLLVKGLHKGLGIRGTHLKSSIQDIVDEVAPIKKAPLWG